MSTDVLWPAATEAAWPCAAQTAELEEEAAVADNVDMGEIDTGAAEEADADEMLRIAASGDTPKGRQHSNAWAPRSALEAAPPTPRLLGLRKAI